VARSAGDLDDPAVRIAYGTGNGQTETRSSRRAASRPIGAIEPFEDVRDMLRGDTLAFVAHGESRRSIRRGGDRYPDAAPGRSVPDRVVEQNHHELVQTVAIPVHGDAARCFQFQDLSRRERFRGTHRFSRDLVEAHGRKVQSRTLSGIASRVGAGEQ
jgi:hypothetical protein